MILQEIKQLKLNARKSKNTEEVQMLTLLEGEIERKDDKSDSSVLKTLKKLIENEGTSEKEVKFYTDLLNNYQKPQLSKEEVFNFIQSQNFSNIGQAQSWFKQNYIGQYDPALVTSTFKEINQ